MLVTISFDPEVFQIEIKPEDSVASLKETLEGVSGIPVQQQLLIHNGKELASSSTMAASSVQEQDLIVLGRRPQAPQQQQQQAASSAADPQQARMQAAMRTRPDGSLENVQEFIEMARQNLPMLSGLPAPLVQAINKNDPEELQRIFRQIHAHREAEAKERQAEMELLSADPFDPEAQARIAERIRQAQVEENYQNAYEYMPESFSQVTMLYVDMEVNGHKVKAFVDSGAQTSIMSQAAAERCSIMRLVDRRFAGIARGVGSAPILGRVHSVNAKIGSQHLPMSITIMEKGPDFLFGLDMLRRYQCNIDLKDNVLRFSVQPEVALPFLHEHELPEAVRFEMQQAEEAQKASGSGVAPAPQAGGAQKPSDAAAAAGAAAAARAASAPGMSLTPGPTPSVQAPQQAPPPSRAAVPAPSDDGDEKVKRLMALGFDRQQCMEVLAACNGNEEHAASLLFEMGGGLGF
ncbi:g5664 [Coccomyxa viridis]|uniref:G5664 protein n=1 Tax=Coccomyxa viridis TaxID=1274662 RepID=A0ABP1FW48_9CHLO